MRLFGYFKCFHRISAFFLWHDVDKVTRNWQTGITNDKMFRIYFEPAPNMLGMNFFSSLRSHFYTVIYNNRLILGKIFTIPLD